MNEYLCPRDSLFLSTSKYEVTWDAQFCFAFFNVHCVVPDLATFKQTRSPQTTFYEILL